MQNHYFPNYRVFLPKHSHKYYFGIKRCQRVHSVSQVERQMGWWPSVNLFCVKMRPSCVESAIQIKNWENVEIPGLFVPTAFGFTVFGFLLNLCLICGRFCDVCTVLYRAEAGASDWENIPLSFVLSHTFQLLWLHCHGPSVHQAHIFSPQLHFERLPACSSCWPILGSNLDVQTRTHDTVQSNGCRCVIKG